VDDIGQKQYKKVQQWSLPPGNLRHRKINNIISKQKPAKEK
jgi:hypothetical protein